mgnify:CR=1 FL=1
MEVILQKLKQYWFSESLMCTKCKVRLRSGNKYCTNCQIKIRSEDGKRSRTKKIMAISP